LELREDPVEESKETEKNVNDLEQSRCAFQQILKMEKCSALLGINTSRGTYRNKREMEGREKHSHVIV